MEMMPRLFNLFNINLISRKVIKELINQRRKHKQISITKSKINKNNHNKNNSNNFNNLKMRKSKCIKNIQAKKIKTI